MNKAFLFLFLIVSIFFVGCSGSEDISVDNTIIDSVVASEEVVVQEESQVDEVKELVQNDRADMNKTNMKLSNDRAEGEAPTGDMQERERPQGGDDMMLSVLQTALPDVYEVYENGEITQEEAMQELMNYMETLSDEERQTLMPEMSDRPEGGDMPAPGDMPER